MVLWPDMAEIITAFRRLFKAQRLKSWKVKPSIFAFLQAGSKLCLTSSGVPNFHKETPLPSKVKLMKIMSFHSNKLFPILTEFFSQDLKPVLTGGWYYCNQGGDVEGNENIACLVGCFWILNERQLARFRRSFSLDEFFQIGRNKGTLDYSTANFFFQIRRNLPFFQLKWRIGINPLFQFLPG